MSKTFLGEKLRLAKALRQNRAMPLFVIAKTKAKLRINKKRRHWRIKKLKT